MSTRRFGALLVTGIAAAMLTLSPVASAKPGYFVFPGGRISLLTVKGSHGFEITIRRSADTVELTASKEHGSVTYLIDAARTPVDVIEAKFPGLGRVSLRFHPSGKVRREPAICKGRASIDQPGVFRGTIRFRGERGFTRVVASHVRGHVYREFKSVCKRSEVSQGKTVPGYFLHAAATSHGSTIFFDAFRATAESIVHGETSYATVMTERRRGMVIARFAFAFTRSGDFNVEGPSARPDSATVTPPRPFTGTASFHAPPGSPTTWEGDLAVELPGADTVPLTGPSFESYLCLNERCAGKRPQASPISVTFARLARAKRLENP